MLIQALDLRWIVMPFSVRNHWFQSLPNMNIVIHFIATVLIRRLSESSLLWCSVHLFFFFFFLSLLTFHFLKLFSRCLSISSQHWQIERNTYHLHTINTETRCSFSSVIINNFAAAIFCTFHKSTYQNNLLEKHSFCVCFMQLYPFWSVYNIHLYVLYLISNVLKQQTKTRAFCV